MRIVSIEPLDRKKSRVLTDEGPAFVLCSGELKTYGIEAGGELTEEKYELLMREVFFRRARERMFRLLKASDKTEAELRRKLADGGCPAEAVEAAIAFGKEKRYIDDRRYAQNYVEYHGSTKSRRQLAAELAARGISRELAQECLEETELDERAQIERLLKKRGYDRDQADQKEQQKTMAFLSRRGFSYEAILDIMHKKY